MVEPNVVDENLLDRKLEIHPSPHLDQIRPYLGCFRFLIEVRLGGVHLYQNVV